MHKYLHLIILPLLLVGCVASKTPEKAKFENDKFLHDLSVLKDCRIDSVKKLDDKISTAEIIASAVISDSSKEAKHVMDTNMLDQSEEFRNNFEKQMNGVQASGVIPMILKHRQNINIKVIPLGKKQKKYKELMIN